MNLILGLAQTLTHRRLLVKRLAFVAGLVVLVLSLVVLLTLGRRDSPRASVVARTFLTPYDTINGEPFTDLSLIQRIEQIAAAGIPKDLLAAHPRGAHVRYVAQGFGAGDDAPIFQGVFRDAAAALAFGCALDDDLSDRCGITSSVGGPAVFEADVPGVHCQPLRLALGAPAFEPERCEAGD